LNKDNDNQEVSGEEDSQEQTSPSFIGVALSYDEKNKLLSAVLSHTDTDPVIDFTSLQELINDQGYESFQVPDPALENVLRKIGSGEIGSVELAEKPVYTMIDFVYNEETRILTAELVSTDENPQLSSATLQKTIQENNYDVFQITGKVLKDLLDRVSKKEQGSIILGKKPEYTQVQLIFDEVENQLNAELTATDDNPKITLESIQAMVSLQKFETLFFEDGALGNLLGQVKSQKRAVFPLAQRKNAEAIITVSTDEMSAFITTTQAYGGKDLTVPVIKTAIQNADIELSFCDRAVLKQALENPVTDLKFAEGKSPVDGIDTQFKALVEEFIYHAPTIDKKTGKSDPNKILDFTIVEPGDQLMQRSPATAGTNGSNVIGQVNPAQPGTDIPYAAGTKGVKVDSNDSSILVASEKGHPIIMTDGVEVDQTLKVDNVDVKTGNITLEGSLLVIGEVLAGMEVNITGDIYVGGIVSSATIIAGNDITVKGGVIGSEKGNDEHSEETNHLVAKLTAGGNIKAKFVSLCVLKADHNIEVSEYIAHSEVHAKGKILIGQAGGKGSLFGGHCHASGGVVTNIVGTDAEVRT
jgi:uncharacterized protein (DUF342 family)